MEENRISTTASADRIVLLSSDKSLADALAIVGIEVSQIGHYFDLGEQLHVSAPHAVIVDFSLGAEEGEQALARCALRFPKVKRFAIVDVAGPCDKALDTFSRPFDPAL